MQDPVHVTGFPVILLICDSSLKKIFSHVFCFLLDQAESLLYLIVSRVLALLMFTLLVESYENAIVDCLVTVE